MYKLVVKSFINFSIYPEGQRCLKQLLVLNQICETCTKCFIPRISGIYMCLSMFICHEVPREDPIDQKEQCFVVAMHNVHLSSIRCSMRHLEMDSCNMEVHIYSVSYL